MKRRIGAFALVFLLMISLCSQTVAASLGPATTYAELLSLAEQAAPGDTLLISGEIVSPVSPALTTSAQLTLRGKEEGAALSGLHAHDAQLTFSSLALSGGLTVTGKSNIQLTRSASVSGGLSFSGSGTLLLDPGSSVTGGKGGTGVRVSHAGGDLYVSIEGTVTGGKGKTGGAAVVIDPLKSSGALMVTGRLTGGEGSEFGGNALNLHNLSGNAYITVDGRLTGGEGSIGGSGLQLITASGSVTAGLGGRITGGRGGSYGGDAMLLMNVGGSALISLSGSLTGGNASGTDSTPGQSLKVLGQTTAGRTRVGDCILQDGRQILTSQGVTPLPAITSSIDSAQPLEPTPEPTPAPPIATDGEAQREEN